MRICVWFMSPTQEQRHEKCHRDSTVNTVYTHQDDSVSLDDKTRRKTVS